MLATTVNEMSSQLVVAQRETVEKERLKREVEIAREIQSRLLPAGPHLVGDFVVGGWQRAAARSVATTTTCSRCPMAASAWRSRRPGKGLGAAW